MSNTTFYYQAGEKEEICRMGGWGMFPQESWWNVNPFTYVMPVTMFQFTMFFIFSQAIFHLFRPLKQIKFVCYMLAGILLGPSVIGEKRYSEMAPEDMAIVRTNVAYIALTFYVFIMAVKIDFAAISRMGKKVWTITAASVFAPYLTALAIGIVCDIQLLDSRILWSTIAYNLSLTPSANLASALDELDLLTTNLGELSTSSALLNDFCSWIYFALMAILRHEKSSKLFNLLSTCIILAFVIGVLRPLVLLIIEKTPEGKPIKEAYTVGILVGVLALRGVMEAVGGNALQGPLLLGLIIPAGPPLGSALTKRVEIIVTELLMPFFYMEMGAGMNLRAIDTRGDGDSTSFIVFEGVIAISYIAKFVGTICSCVFHDMKLEESLKLGLLMSIRGSMEFVLYMLFKRMNILSEAQHAALVLSALVQTAIITPLIKIFCKPQNKIDELDIYFASSLQYTSFDSELRILSCVHHEDNIPGLITLLQASNQSTTFPICAYVIHMIELVGETAPSLTMHKQHRRRCAYNGCHRIMSAFRNYCKDSNHRVAMQPYTLIAPLKSMHEMICRLALDMKAPMVLIPFVQKDGEMRQGNVAFNSIISKLQSSARCTVGVLVDRGSRLCIDGHDHHDTYSIGVFFIGGDDDREALAYSTYMLNHPSITVTLHRLQIKNEANIEEETRLDDLQVEEFRRMSMNNPRAVLKNANVNDWEHALRTIRPACEGYDLVMVGRRQGNTHGIAREMFAWTENPELGVVGDMVASLNYTDRNISVLVVKHSGKMVTDEDLEECVLI